MIDVEELTAALAGPRPDREAVLASFHRKHRRRKARRRACWAGGLAACVAVALTIVTTAQPRPGSGPTAASPAGCAPASLARSLAGARQAGASILEAYGSPSGATAANSRYRALVLNSVRTLSGPVIASGTIAWTDGTAIGAGTAATATAGGEVLAIAWPAAVIGSAVGPVVRTAPVVAGNVIFTSGCAGVASRPDGQLAITLSGRYAVPLRIVERAAVSPLAGSPGAVRQGVATSAPTPASNPSPASSASGSSTANGNGNANGKAAAKAPKAAAKASAKAAKASAHASTASAKASTASAKASKAAAKASKAAAAKAKGNGNGNG